MVVTKTEDRYCRGRKAEEALTQIYHDKPFEYDWETIYGENDMW